MAKRPPQLDYAPAPPLSRSRRIARRILGWLALGLLLLVALQYGPPLWRQVWYLRGQRQCMEFTVPTAQVVYCNDPAAAATLLSSGYKPVASAVGRSLGAASTAGASMSAGFAPPVLASVGE